MPNLLRRKFSIKSIENKDVESRTIVHLQYATWPDHGVPEESDYKIIGKILDYIKEYHASSKANNNENKIIIHCSAGIGRTGTLIAIYNL